MATPSKSSRMNSKRIGNVGEAKVLAKLVEFGIPVYIQFGDDEPADYIILNNNVPIKVQVKTAASYNKNYVLFKLTSSTVHRSNGKKHVYTRDEVDAFICYDRTKDKLFVVKNDGKLTSITFRYSKPSNKQVKGIHIADDYYLCVETLHGVSGNR